MGRVFRLGRRRWLLWAAAALALLALLAVGKAWHDTMREPVVHRTAVTLEGLPTASAPLKVVLVSDIHVAGPDMPPERLQRIVSQINALEPDAVFIAGDLVSDKRLATHVYTPAEIVAPLAGLVSRFGTYVVPGNHDHWFDMAGLAQELRRHGITLLANEATRVGPLAVGGLDDDYTGRADIPAMMADLDGLPAPRIVLSHSPDPFPDLPNSVQLVLAGHTHCGQIRLPIVGAVSYLSKYGDRYACGRHDEDGRSIVVGAGLGTSLMPVRFGTVPEIWLIELRAK